MARYLIIENDVVINVVEADAAFASSQGWISHGTAGKGWTYDGEEFSPPVEPDPEPSAASPQFYAAARMEVIDGEVGTITANWNWKIAAGVKIDVGEYWVFFAETMPDTDYMAKAWDGAKNCTIYKEEQYEDYFVVRVTDGAGDPVDPSVISVEIIRAT